MGIFKYHDIKISKDLLDYLAKEIGGGKYLYCGFFRILISSRMYAKGRESPLEQPQEQGQNDRWWFFPCCLVSSCEEDGGYSAYSSHTSFCPWSFQQEDVSQGR